MMTDNTIRKFGCKGFVTLLSWLTLESNALDINLAPTKHSLRKHEFHFSNGKIFLYLSIIILCHLQGKVGHEWGADTSGHRQYAAFISANAWHLRGAPVFLPDPGPIERECFDFSPNGKEEYHKI